MKDQRHQLEVPVGDGVAWIGEADQLPDNIVRPLHFPVKVNAVFIWVDPDPSGALSWGIYVDYDGHGPVENIGKVGWAGFYLDTQAPPEFNILVEPGGEVGRGVLGSLGAGKGNLHGVEVPNAPQNG